MVGGYFTVFRRDKEEGVTLLTFDFDISLIASLSIVNKSFMFQVKVMAVISRRLSIIKDSLVGARDREYISEDEGSFSCRYTHGDVEGESKAEGIKGVMDIEDGGRLFRERMGKLLIGEMIFSELVSKFKLRGSSFSEELFSDIKFGLIG
jgi:hypothetical protein